MKNICLVQARLGSRRFPEKIIKEVKNELTVLDILFKRLSKSELIDEIIFCIPNSISDDKLAAFLDKRNINYKRGHPENLIDRYINSLKDFNDCIIIRVTSDCPLVDPFWIDKSIQGKIDYHKVEKLKNNFDLNLCGKIQLIKSLNEDKYFIIDGLHRVMAIKSLGIKRLMKTNVQSEKLIEDTYMSNNPILVDKDTGI